MPYSKPAELTKDAPARPERGLSAPKYILYTLLLLGIVFRGFHFLDNRSLWLDEIYVALNVLSSTFQQLTAPLLEYQQKTPIGFLWMVKFSAILFGDQEQALRLVSLLSGIAALCFFVPVCRHWLRPTGQIVALGIMAVAPPLVYHAVEVKQYSMELLATVLCLWLFVRFNGKEEPRDRILWGMAGAAVLWFSYSSVFILTGIGAAVCLHLLYKREWKNLWRTCLPFSIWFFSFALHYALITSKQNSEEWLLYWFRHYNSFMPRWSPDTPQWLIHHLYTMLDYPLGLLWNFNNAENTILRTILKMSFLPIAMLLTGIYAFSKTDKQALLLMVLPFVLTLAASALELYPFLNACWCSCPLLPSC